MPSNPAVIVEGQVVRVARSQGDFTNTAGEKIEYDFHLVRILTPEMDVTEVKVKRGTVEVPEKGSQVRFVCEARVQRGETVLLVQSQDAHTYAELLTLAGDGLTEAAFAG